MYHNLLLYYHMLCQTNTLYYIRLCREGAAPPASGGGVAPIERAPP